MPDLQVRGPLFGSTGSPVPFTASFDGAQRVADAHPRFAQAAIEGRLYSIGCGATALSATTITLTATSTPILAVWNPPTNDKNLIIAQCSLQVYINTLTTPVGSGPFVWASSAGNTALTLGTAPFNRKTMALAGSSAKGYGGGLALTGLTTTPLVVFSGAHFQNTTIITHGTVTAVTTQSSVGGVQNFDGNLIVPPGVILALYNTTSTTTCSVAGELLWEEVPIFT